MDRRAFLGAVAGSFLAGPTVALAQQPRKVYRVGVLAGGMTAGGDPFGWSTENLRTLGYIEGQNLILERRFAEGKLADLPRLASDLVQARVDLIVTLGTPATKAAKEASATIPIVFFTAADPVAIGLVVSMAHPGGNLTGFAQGIYIYKQFEILKETIPGLSRVGFLHDLNYAAFPRAILDPVQRRGLRVDIFDVKNANDFDNAFAAVSTASVKQLVVENSPFFTDHFPRIVQLAQRFRLATIGHTPEYAELGGLLAYGAATNQYRPAFAPLLDKIFKGVKPADIPVWQPTNVQFAINLKTAKALGLRIPPALLVRADQVIE